MPWVELATLPTPIEPLAAAGPDVWVKRDGLTSPRYGGNKVRTLEPLCALAADRGAKRIIGTGAYGSNHVLATATHAPVAGLKVGAILFPQPRSKSAMENAAFTGTLCRVQALSHWIFLPWAMWRARRPDTYVMVPGGAIPAGTLGYVSAAFEVALQVQQGLLPAPRTVVLPVGSTCTSAGLLAGFALAEQLVGLPCPELRSVRVTPWPVTAGFRIRGLAERALRYIAAHSDISPPSLGRLTVDGAQLGRGYGHATDAGRAAVTRLAGLKLDLTYSAKAAAALDQAQRPTLFWATKSETLPPKGDLEPPERMERWASRSSR